MAEQAASQPSTVVTLGAAAAARVLKTIELSKLRYEAQTRERLKESLVDEYATAMRGGAQFPPPVVFMDEHGAWVADGFHRIAARKKLGELSVECSVNPRGGLVDAVAFGAKANDANGLRRSNADKRRSVVVMLSALAARGEAWSDRRIAEACGVDCKTVAAVRSTAEVPQLDANAAKPRVTARNGRQYPAPRPRPEAPNVFVAIRDGLRGAVSRIEADRFYGDVTMAAGEGSLTQSEAEELTDEYRAAIARIESAPEPAAIKAKTEEATQRRIAVKHMHDNGMGTADISRALGVKMNVVSHDKAALGIGENNAAVRLWRDVQHISAALEGSVAHIEKLATTAAEQSLNATQEEIESCAKKLSKAATAIRQLSTALRGRPQ